MAEEMVQWLRALTLAEEMFGFQHPHGGLQLPGTPVLGDPILEPDSHVVHKHTYMQTKHSHIKCMQ